MAVTSANIASTNSNFSDIVRVISYLLIKKEDNMPNFIYVFIWFNCFLLNLFFDYVANVALDFISVHFNVVEFCSF